jgi:hypothetical protein
MLRLTSPFLTNITLIVRCLGFHSSYGLVVEHMLPNVTSLIYSSRFRSPPYLLIKTSLGKHVMHVGINRVEHKETESVNGLGFCFTIITRQEQEQEHILYWFEHRFLTKWLHSIRCGEKYNKYIRGYSAHMDISQHLNNTNTALLVSTYYEFC